MPFFTRNEVLKAFYSRVFHFIHTVIHFFCGKTRYTFCIIAIFCIKKNIKNNYFQPLFFVRINNRFPVKNSSDMCSNQGGFFMIKGVNRQVVEITQTKCEYFERVLFFIKPEFSAVSDGELKERASAIAQSAGIPPAERLRKNKIRSALRLGAAAFTGAALSGLIFLISSFA